MSQSPQMRDEAKDQIEEESGGVLPVQPLQFIQVDDYTTFRAEFAITEGDIVFHFFKTAEVMAKPPEYQRHYWGTVFAHVLEPTAKALFKADYPRLKAQHIDDGEMKLDSWWFRAYGFGHLLDPDALAFEFLDALDEALDARTNA